MRSRYSRRCAPRESALTFYGIRMDSGDLRLSPKEAKKCSMRKASRTLWISASNDLDETPDHKLKEPGRNHQLLGCRHKPDHLK